MKKFVFVGLLLALLAMCISAESAIRKRPNTGGFNTACYKCNEATLQTNKGYCYCLGCQAWRCYRLESNHYVWKYSPEKKEYRYVSVGPEKPGYMVYKCQHGHTLYLSFTSDSKL